MIQKTTTPAYRAPEMWGLFARQLINEKVDVWALGCVSVCLFNDTTSPYAVAAARAPSTGRST